MTSKNCRQRDAVVWSVHGRKVKWFNSQPSLVVASLDKMLHDDYLCLVESGKQQIKEVGRKFNRKTWKQRQLLSESGFVLRIAPPPLFYDRRIAFETTQTGHGAFFLQTGGKKPIAPEDDFISNGRQKASARLVYFG